MRFLIHGNAPHVKTGYGVQVAQLVERLDAAGHEVAVSCTYGQQGGGGTWRGVQLYPCGYEVNSNDVIHHHAHHWFDGDPAGGWIITLLDVWALQNPLLADFNVAAWVPVDHFPVPPGVLDFFKRTGATPVAMSRFGERLLFDAGLDPVFVPLSVDTKALKPTAEIGGRTAREFLEIPADAFVVGMVAMNKGWARDRKGFNEAFRAFGAFWQSHPEAILYLHSEKFGAAEGMNLVELLQHASVPPHAVRWVDQYAYRLGVPAEMMAATYTAMDVLLAPSHGEGFCVPLIEAQACFPASALVTAADVEQVFEHSFTGELVTVETERGDLIEATTDHPFWTESGWVTAGDLTIGEHRLLYTGGHAEAEHVHSGRLGDVVAALRNDAAGRRREGDGAHLRVGALAQEPDGHYQAVFADRRAASDDGDRDSTRLHRRADRRRGHRLDSEVQWEVEASHPDRELVGAAHGLAVGNVHDARNLHREATAARVTRADALHVSHPRPGAPTALRGALASPRYQGTAVGMPHRVHSAEVVSEPRGTADAPPVGTCPTRARPEYQAIRSVSRRAVVDFPVYNLKTKSGTYMAGGYLVHNCGTPVIATDATAQPELVGAGWLVGGQPEWDPAQHASYVCPSIPEIIQALEQAHAADRAAMAQNARAFAKRYDADVVFDGFWRPLIETLEPVDIEVPYVREPMNRVAVIVPAMRPENMLRLVRSFNETNDGTARLFVVADEGSPIDADLRMGESKTTYAEKVNAAFGMTDEDWVFVAADDVEFAPGWLEAARKVSDRFDVIGTNDTDGPVKNPTVASGQHADHFFVRRAYVDEFGGCLDGPGVLAPTAYKHWYTDMEIVGLAKARRVFAPCLDSVVVHHHPGYDGAEDRRIADPVYMTAVHASEDDAKTYHDRAPLIEMQRVGRAK